MTIAHQTGKIEIHLRREHRALVVERNGGLLLHDRTYCLYKQLALFNEIVLFSEDSDYCMRLMRSRDLYRVLPHIISLSPVLRLAVGNGRGHKSHHHSVPVNVCIDYVVLGFGIVRNVNIPVSLQIGKKLFLVKSGLG